MIFTYRRAGRRGGWVQVVSSGIRAMFLRTIEFALPETMKGTTRPVIKVKSTRLAE